MNTVFASSLSRCTEMPAYARREIVANDRIGVYHCVARCVRRSFLCAFDPVSGKNHDHRKQWIRERLQKLASVFGIDVCGYAVMSNHLQVVSRIRPDPVAEWTDDEIALRWLWLFPPRDPLTARSLTPRNSISFRSRRTRRGSPNWVDSPHCTTAAAHFRPVPPEEGIWERPDR